jgi:hypothetical protein
VAVGWQALIVGVLAGFVGLAELVNRYRSDPWYAVTRSVAAWVYIGLNALAGVGALLLIRAFDWSFGQTEHVDLWRVLIAGFAALAFFRSALFIARIGDTDVGVGPSLVLGALLDACDREVDRRSAERMSEVVRDSELEGLDPDKVMFALPVLSLALMQSFPASDQAQLGAELVVLRNDDTLSPEATMRAVIIQLSKYLSPALVAQVLTDAREIFVATPAAPSQSPAAAEPAALIEEARRQLAEQKGGSSPPDGA